jgi:hypothetical protein
MMVPPESRELEPVELPQEVQHVVESPQQKQPMVKLLSADEERWRWQELVPPKLESLLKEVLLEMKLPMKQKQPQKMGERGSSLYLVPCLGTEAAIRREDLSRKL